MPHAEFDVVTLSPSTVRVMHKVAHHIYEFAVVDDGAGRHIVSRGPSIKIGEEGPVPAWDIVAAQQVAAAMARFTGVID